MIETFVLKRPWWKRKRTWFTAVVILTLLILVIFTWQQTLPPKNFPIGQGVNISRGLSAASIAEKMKEANVIKSADILYLALILYHDPSSVQTGLYVFDQPLNVFEVADRLSEVGAGKDNLAAVTLPEGFTVVEFAEIASQKLPDFDIDLFKSLGREGYLFPDTYYVPNDFTATELISLLADTYEQKTADMKTTMSEHPLQEGGVIILASLIEREANTEESMRMVSGILQNRLSIDMALQADASIEYVLGHSLEELSAEDLGIDSPYNTYLYRGLPPTAIGNPGLTAIKAVLDPIKNDYFYYITDNEGNFHYAKTFDEHRDNIAKYLR